MKTMMMMTTPGFRTRLPKVAIVMGEQTYNLCLTPMACYKIEEAAGIGIFEMFKRMIRGEPYAGDAVLVLNSAFQESGYSHADTQSFMSQHVIGKPIAGTVQAAAAVLGAAIHGLGERADG